MQFSNSDKSEHGENAKNTLNAILAECKKYNYIKEIIKDYRCGYAKYDDKQFYCNFVIIFQDNTKWIINITTSFRSDRVKGNQWDSYNIKEIDKSISKSILVYPDSLSENEKDAFILYKTKIINHIHFSAIDEIVGESELFELIENFANKNLSVGVKKDKQGNIFEVFISDILSNKENFTKWKNNSPTGIGFHFEYYEKILNAFKLNKSEVLEISATADKNIIGNLKTLGKPKTDIVVFVKTSDKTVKNFTISCKKSSANSVSVHQYSADAFADALDKNNLKLKNLLNEFQKIGNLRDF